MEERISDGTLMKLLLRPGITKSGREEFCTITDPVKIVLEEIFAYEKPPRARGIL